MLNKKVLSKIDLGSYTKPNPFHKDIIYDPRGQWDHPGQNTRIPGEDITVQGVPYPVYAQPNVGQPQMMYPDQNYQFPGADYVDEFPQMKKGGRIKGLVSMPKPSKKGLMSNKYSRSLDATNKLFTENFLFAKPKSRKNKVFDPNANYAKGGALLTKKVTCKKCGWEWDAADGGNDITTCHKCGGQGLVHAQDGGDNTDAMTGMMKARLAYANEFGNPAAERMINLPDNPYQFDNGDTGSHYMASMDNYAVPQIQDENGVLQLGDYGPESNEAIRFDSDEDANYFAENYKDVSPGFIEADLDEDEIEEYRRGGYVVEDISIPSLNQMQDGGTYTVKGSDGVYKKVNGKWQVDWNRSGKYQPLSKGDVKARTVVLDKMAKPLYDKDYDEMVAYKNLSAEDKINKFEPKKELTKEELKNISNRLGRDYKPEDTKLQSVDMVYPEKYIIGPGGGLLNQGLKTGVGAIEKLAATKIPGLFGTTVGQAAGAGFAADALVNQFPGAISDIGKGEYEDAAEKALYGTLGLVGSGIGKGVVSGTKDLGKFLGTDSGVLSNTYKINPWAFKPNEANWYRQVGKSGIDDAVETGLVREIGEEVSPRMWGEFQNQIKRLQGDDAILDYNERYMQQMLAGRRPNSPYFAKGELFYPMDKKVTMTKSGKISKNPAAKGTADYLIETDLPNESFQPAYVKGMYLGVPEEIGSTAILKPNPELRNLENFNLYKKNWLQGYKRYKEVPKQLPGSPNKEELVDLWRIQEKNARPMSDLATEGKLGAMFKNEKAIKHFKDREEHFGQWFTKDKADLDWYKKDREFANPEIINLKVPKSKLDNYSNYNKSLSSAPDREFVIPYDQQSLYKVPLNTKMGSGLGIDMSKYEIKNPDYYTQLLNTYDNKTLSSTNKKFYKDLINTVKKQNGILTERQYNELQRLKNGNFNFGKKGYANGGASNDYVDVDLTPEEIKDLIAQGYVIKELN